MSDRDYKVVYRTREVDVDEDRPRRRVTEALDPYRYPEDREELKRGVAEARTRVARKYRVDRNGDLDERDDYSSVSVRERERERERERDHGRSSRKTYTVRDDHVERETEVGRGRGSRASEVRERDIELDYNERVSLGGGSIRREERELDRGEIEVDLTRRSRRGPYVVETTPGYDVEIIRGGHRDRGRDSPSVREIDTRKAEIVKESRDSPRSSSRLFEVDGGEALMSGARSRDEVIEERDAVSRTSRRSGKRASTRAEEEDMVVIEKKESRAPSVHERFTDPFEGSHASERGRVRAATLKSEDDFVMVSSERGGRQRDRSEGPLRSAFYDPNNYTEEELRTRRRSRSISFREKEARYHDAGEQLHERPGAEAALMGRYLNHYDRDDRESHRRGSRDRESFEYHDVIRDNRGYGREHARYPPQRFPRDRSRHRRERERERESDDESYVSRKVEKTTKYTYY